MQGQVLFWKNESSFTYVCCGAALRAEGHHEGEASQDHCEGQSACSSAVLVFVCSSKWSKRFRWAKSPCHSAQLAGLCLEKSPQGWIGWDCVDKEDGEPEAEERAPWPGGPCQAVSPCIPESRAYCSHCRSAGEDRSPSSWRFETLSFKLVLSRAPIDFPFKESVGENQIWAKFIGLRWVVRAKPCSSPPLSWRPSVFVLCVWP